MQNWSDLYLWYFGRTPFGPVSNVTKSNIIEALNKKFDIERIGDSYCIRYKVAVCVLGIWRTRLFLNV